ncbi:MAG TPA: ribulose-phosphate 3-epimerase, partial [Spirochaetota bacterium]|nr:ribulose-phosphate 3-epimerase [Spirochaetota bacterium]HPN82839.1 ribulose-phosphate 3-epimerase [Spirochaetota bacterium]
IAEEIHALQAGGADAIHYDVMDNHFVPNLTFGFKFIEDAMKASRLPADVHLMISDPGASLDKWLALKPAALTFHLEAEPDAVPLINRIKAAGVRAFLSIKPATPVSALSPFLQDLDGVLIMLVEPGFGGQAMLPSTVAKIAELRNLAADLEIQIDGGIKMDNYKELVSLGADNLVIGSGIFAYSDYAAAIAAFRK